MKIPKKIEEKVRLTHASFTKRFFCSLFDILFVIMINLPVFLILAKMTGGTSDGQIGGWYNLDVKPLTMMAFSIYIFFNYLIYITYLPVYFKHQTIFSMLFGIRAITLTGQKPNFFHWFKSFFVVVFLTIFVNIVLFTFASSLDIKVFELSFNINTNNPLEKYWKTPIKIMFLAAIFIQIHYLFTVALSCNPINWYTRFSNLVFIDIAKEAMFCDEKPSFKKLANIGTEEDEEDMELMEEEEEDEDYEEPLDDEDEDLDLEGDDLEDEEDVTDDEESEDDDNDGEDEDEDLDSDEGDDETDGDEDLDEGDDDLEEDDEEDLDEDLYEEEEEGLDDEDLDEDDLDDEDE